MQQLVQILKVVLLVATTFSSAFGYTLTADQVQRVRILAETGDAAAQNIFGELYYYGHGHGIEQDKRKAARWYRKSAEQGNSDAQVNLGNAYYFGEGVAKDKRESVRWYRESADSGHVSGQYNLAVAYDDGDGVAEDRQAAAHWYREAAEQGDANAQARLAEMYWDGDGVSEDSQKAVYWFRKSALQGSVLAQMGMIMAYSYGRGVDRDLREAYIWADIAKSEADEGPLGYVVRTGIAFAQLILRLGLSQAEIQTAQEEAVQRLIPIAASEAQCMTCFDDRKSQ